MNPTRPRSTKLLRRLEAVLWVAGCCALCYCAFWIGDAALTQANLSRQFERTRSVRSKPPTSLLAPKPGSPSLVKRLAASPKEETLGLLDIPRIGVSAMVVEGVGSRMLRIGLGHIPGSSGPGEEGNVAIAGHRDTFFHPLGRIERGDEILFETSKQDYRYRVVSLEVVDPTDIAVLKSRENHEMTLITCYPLSYIGPAPKRLVVHAVLEQ